MKKYGDEFEVKRYSISVGHHIEVELEFKYSMDNMKINLPQDMIKLMRLHALHIV